MAFAICDSGLPKKFGPGNAAGKNYKSGIYLTSRHFWCRHLQAYPPCPLAAGWLLARGRRGQLHSKIQHEIAQSNQNCEAPQY
jgi:hypothetical protein